MHSYVPRELQCGYRSKICQSMRATKLDGTLHKLCEFHRRKANSSQRRLQRRRQMRRLQEDEAIAICSDSPTTLERQEKSVESMSPTTNEDFDLLNGWSSFQAMMKVELTETPSTATLEVKTPIYDAVELLDLDVVVSEVLADFAFPELADERRQLCYEF